MIYRSPEPKGQGPRLGANRELALWLVAMAFLSAVVLTLARVPGQPQLAELSSVITSTLESTPMAYSNPTQGAGASGSMNQGVFSTPTPDFFGSQSPAMPIATSSMGFGQSVPTPPNSMFPSPASILPDSSGLVSPALPTIGLPSSSYPGPSVAAATTTPPGLFSANVGASPTPGPAASTMTAVAQGTAGTLPTVTATGTVTGTTSAYPGTGTPTATTRP